MGRTPVGASASVTLLAGDANMAWHKPDSPRPSTPEEPNLWALTGKGLELAAAVGVFALLGWWVDKWLGTPPWFFLALAGVGLIGGLYNLWKGVRKYL